MKVDITARHMDLSESLENHVKTNLEGLTRFFGHILTAEVVIDQVRHNFEVEIQLKVTGQTIFGKATNDDAYRACDLVFDKLQRQVTDLKDKRSSHKSGTKENFAPEGTPTEEEENEE